MFYPCCIFYLLSFFSSVTLRAHWTELNQNLLHVRMWVRCESLTEIIFGMKHDIDNSGAALETAKASVQRHKLSWTLVHKRLIVGLSCLPILSRVLFCFIASHRTCCECISVALHSESKWNAIRLLCSSGAKPQKDFNLAMASRRAALSGNASLIATLSSILHSTIATWSTKFGADASSYGMSSLSVETRYKCSCTGTFVLGLSVLETSLKHLKHPWSWKKESRTYRPIVD